MANPPGNPSAIDALNRSMPAAKRVNLGQLLANLVASVNGIAQNMDNSGSRVNASVTNTIGGSITNGDTFTVTFINPNVPALVTPGITVGPVSIVGADTTTTVAAKFAALVNGSAPLKGLNISADSTAAVAHAYHAGLIGNNTTLSTALKGGATITTTLGNGGVLAGGVGSVGSANFANFGLPKLDTY